MEYFPEIVQVMPNRDYTVYVYFADGKIVLYDVKPYLEKGAFTVLQDTDFFMERCTILNDMLAWDVTGNRDVCSCIDIDPEVLYGLPEAEERTA